LPSVKYRDNGKASMLLKAVPDEEYCIRSKAHSHARAGRVVFCYRCMMMLGKSSEPVLGTLLDF
jgi:hypothetical protein